MAHVWAVLPPRLRTKDAGRIVLTYLNHLPQGNVVERTVHLADIAALECFLDKNCGSSPLPTETPRRPLLRRLRALLPGKRSKG